MSHLYVTCVRPSSGGEREGERREEEEEKEVGMLEVEVLKL